MWFETQLWKVFRPISPFLVSPLALGVIDRKIARNHVEIKMNKRIALALEPVFFSLDPFEGREVIFWPQGLLARALLFF